MPSQAKPVKGERSQKGDGGARIWEGAALARREQQGIAGECSRKGGRRSHGKEQGRGKEQG